MHVHDLLLFTIFFHMFTFESQPIPPPESRCRQNALLPSKSGQSQATKLGKDARRRRLELRRIRSSSPPKSTAELQEKAATEGALTDSEGGPPSVRRRSYGKISVVGRRREMTNVVDVELGFAKRGDESYDFFGIFDGRERRRVALAYSQMLHQMLAMVVEEESEEDIDWEEVMMEGFDEAEAKIIKNGAVAKTIMGSDAVVAVVGDNEMVVAAKCLGSKAVVERGGEAVQLLVEKAGSNNVRVSISRNREDEFLILGSRGFWDVISDEVACQVARSYCSTGDDGAAAAAAAMAELAVAQGSKDNISVILVDLRGWVKS